MLNKLGLVTVEVVEMQLPYILLDIWMLVFVLVDILIL